MVAELSPLRHRPLDSLLASAYRITNTTIKDRRGFSATEQWQSDAWEMYDLVGEQRFLSSTLAGRLGQARLYAGKLPTDPLDEPTPLRDGPAYEVFKVFGASPLHRQQMLARLGVNLFVAGDGWLVGIPRRFLPPLLSPPSPTSTATPPGTALPPTGGAGAGTDLADLADLDWRMLSVSEADFAQEHVVLTLGSNADEKIVVNPDDVFLIRVWRPHPRRWWQADSPTRASLPVLRELVGLTMHVSAQVDSRLAGAGLLVVPQSVRQALNQAAGIDPNSDEDTFTDSLIEAMMTPIQDRSNASAIVPLVVTVPDDAAQAIRHISFSSPLDQEARQLRDEAIRRLALGQDCPPELLLGTAGQNHWGAWLVREDVVSTHIEPSLALICDALTMQYLRPVLMQQGMSEEEAAEFVVWYDVSQLVTRPNRLADASSLFDKGVISEETLREAAGFGDADAPPQLDQAVQIAVELAKSNPALIDNMKEIIAAFNEVLNPPSPEALLEEGQAKLDEAEEPVVPPGTEVPQTPGPAPEPDAPPDTENGVSSTSGEPPGGGERGPSGLVAGG